MLGIGWGTVAYHTHVLRQRGRIVIHHQGREACLFPTGISSEQMAWLSTRRNPVHSSIAERVAQTPGLRASEIAASLDRSPNTVRRHLGALAKLGIVAHSGQYGRRYYIPDSRPTAIAQFFSYSPSSPPTGPKPAGQGLVASPSPRRRYDGEASRDLILAAVREAPGIHASDLARVTKLSWGNLTHHLRILEEERLLAKCTQGARACYFDSHISSMDWPRLIARRDAINAIILDALAGNPTMALGDLARLTGTPPRAIGRHMRRLVEQGLVQTSDPLGERLALAAESGPDKIEVLAGRL